MNRTELKCRIDELEHLPTLPHVAAQVLALPSGLSDSPVELAELVSSDPSLAAQILRAANASETGARTPCTGIPEAIDRLGPGFVHSTVLSIALSTVGSATVGNPVDQQAFWKHCVATGVCAELVADRMGSIYKPEAFVAGLLHDIGKIVLQMVAPEAYGRAVDAAQRHGLFILEAERRELGIDHALIGKWLSERWALPHLFTDVIWLHHHEPGTLDSTQYPVELIEVVNLANMLAHESLRNGARGANAVVSEDHLQRLGLRRSDLEEVRAQAPSALAARLQSLPASDDGALSAEALQKATRELLLAGARFDHQAKTLLAETKRLRALNGLHARLRPRQPLREVIDAVAEAVRTGLNIGAGACLAADARERLVLGRRWQAPHDRGRDFQINLDAAPTSALTTIDPALAGPLQKVAFVRADDGWAGAEVRAVARYDDLLVVPMRADNRTLGHIVLDMAPGAPVLSEADHASLQEFAEACGRALARQRAEESLVERSEELAAALWKKEVAFKKELQAERSNSEANVAAGAAQALSKHLAEITIQAQLLLHRHRSEADAGALGAIVQRSRRAHKVLEDLLAFARTPLPRLEPLLLHFLLHQTLAQHRDRLAEKDIHIVETYAEGVPRVLVDRHQFVQAVTELIKNAEDALAGRGGTLAVETSTSSDRRYVSVTISDTGPGVPPALRERVFEPFFSTREGQERLGLGLSLCRRVVEKLRGTIDLESTPGAGSRFILTFPSTVHLSAQRAASTSLPPEDDAAVAGPTVLVVDDEEALCRILRENLEQRGYRVETASDGLEGLRTVATQSIDLVLLDMCMPTRDGLSVLAELHDRFSSVPVIVMTGLASNEDVENALRLGARSCLSKPFELSHLLAEIEMVLAPDKRERKP